MIEPVPRKQQTWVEKIPCDGGPVSYLTIHDRGTDLRIPLEMTMGDQGTYRYDPQVKRYRWIHRGR